MFSGIRRFMVSSFVFLLAPAALAAQVGAPAGQQQLPPEAQQLVNEMQQLQSQLQPIQQEALQDPEIQAEQQALGATIQEAMAEADPQVPEHMERLRELASQAQEAQAAQDQQKMATLVTEAQQIEQQLRVAQAEAVEQPEIATRMESFQDRVRSKMLEVDPQAEQLIERLEEIQLELQTMMQQNG